MFRFSKVETEGILNVSKWLNIQVLLDVDEMHDLINQLSLFNIIPVGCIINKMHPFLSHEDFFKCYSTYIEALKIGQEPDPRSYSAAFSCALSMGPEEFYALDVSANTMLVKPCLPVVQMQAHSMGYSVIDEQIYPMVRGPDTISWGIQFSFPSLFQDKKSVESSNTLKEERFRNNILFQEIQKWMRRHTRSTPMMVRQKVINLPIRIGHQCFSWINNHPKLRFHGLVVSSEGEEG
jgi:hypothetical protein